MLAWDTICRVCSSPAQYEVFAKIPTYLHETSNEFINWQKPINTLIEETTGLKVTKEDGLPTSICALCISYLKHASSFRDQVIKNTLTLQVIKHLHQEQLASRTEDKDSLLITEQELLTSEQRKIDTNVLTDKLRHNEHQKVSKDLFQVSGVAAPSQEYVTQQMRYINLLFDKDLNNGINEINRQGSGENEGLASSQQQSVDPDDYETETTSNDENDDESFANPTMSKGHIFSYSEKNFEEDDVMNLEELRAAINITIPETCKERKCRACFRRFMFEDSYEEHMEKCIEYKFLLFIEEMNLLLDIRRKKAVSPHEFIRRTIFSLRKICEFLKLNCDEVLLLPELSNSNYSTMNTNNKTNLKDLTTATEAVLDDETIEESISQHEDDAVFVLPRHKDVFRTEKDDLLTDQSNFSLSQRLLSCESPTTKGSTTPISIHNNILYEIERSESRNANILKTTNIEFESNTRVMRPIPMHATIQDSIRSSLNRTPTDFGADERMTFLQKLERAAYQTPKQTTRHSPLTTPSISVRKDLMPNASLMPSSPSSFSACCNQCNLIFDTLNAFEIHNAVYHNNAADEVFEEPTHRQRRSSEEERNRIIAMFENEDI